MRVARTEMPVTEGTWTNPRRIRIEWCKPIRYVDLDRWEAEYSEQLYAVYKRNRILYIGMAYCQYVDEKLDSHHKLPEIARKEDTKGLMVTFGKFHPKEDRRISKELVEEAKNLLIYAYEPEYNERGVWTHSGRELMLYNSGTGNIFDRILSSRQFD